MEIFDRPSSLDQIIKAYKDLLPSIGGPITKLGTINPERLKPILAHLAKDEEEVFQQREVIPSFRPCIQRVISFCMQGHNNCAAAQDRQRRTHAVIVLFVSFCSFPQSILYLGHDA